MDKATEIPAYDAAPHLPLQERVLDKLADILFASDEIIDMLSDDRRAKEGDLHTVETSVRSVYHQINTLMKRLVD